MKQPISYEFPLNEFIRNSLKIDRLLKYFSSPPSNKSEYYLRNIYTRVLEIHGLLSKAELKNELIKEVEKKQRRLNNLRKIDSIDQSTLAVIIKKLDSALSELKNIPSDSYSKPLPYLADAIKQRESVPGGQFDFDMPAYKCLLNTNPEKCYNEALNIIDAYTPITSTITLLLDLLRQSGEPKSCIAESGFLQINDKTNCDLIIVTPQSDKYIYPEISGGKHRIFIRFMTLSGINDKPAQTKDDVSFQMVCCFI